jgi:hypothetical protein
MKELNNFNYELILQNVMTNFYNKHLCIIVCKKHKITLSNQCRKENRNTDRVIFPEMIKELIMKDGVPKYNYLGHVIVEEKKNSYSMSCSMK